MFVPNIPGDRVFLTAQALCALYAEDYQIKQKLARKVLLVRQRDYQWAISSGSQIQRPLSKIIRDLDVKIEFISSKFEEVQHPFLIMGQTLKGFDQIKHTLIPLEDFAIAKENDVYILNFDNSIGWHTGKAEWL